jgi:hypothetical protein
MSVPQVEIAVNTQSQPIPNVQEAATVPTITLNGNAIAAPGNKPYSPSGWQLVVLDSAVDLTTPAAVLSNFYAPIPEDGGSWGDWEAVYDIMLKQVLTSGNLGMQIAIMATYGIDLNQPPTNSGLQMMFGFGAGAQLQSWITTAIDAGSEGGGWTQYPTDYILIGASALSYGNGTEVFESGTSPLKTSATATFANPGALAAAA